MQASILFGCLLLTLAVGLDSIVNEVIAIRQPNSLCGLHIETIATHGTGISSRVESLAVSGRCEIRTRLSHGRHGYEQDYERDNVPHVDIA